MTSNLWAIFFLGSAVIVMISRDSLRQPRSHGFFRFFAWEILLAMFVRNVDGWFARPSAWYQLISWALLTISLVLVIRGSSCSAKLVVGIKHGMTRHYWRWKKHPGW